MFALFGLSVLTTSRLDWLRSEARAGALLAVGVEALVKQAREEGGCNFVDRLAGLHGTYTSMKGGDDGK